MPRVLKLDQRPPAYDSVGEASYGPEPEGEIEDDVEMAEWRPVRPPTPATTTAFVFVDGVERRDRRIAAEGDGMPVPGLLASFGAGAVVTGETPAIRHATIERRLILADGARSGCLRLEGGGDSVEYLPAHSAGSDAEGLEATLRSLRAALEVETVRRAQADADALVIIDGRLPPDLDPSVVGLIKTPQVLPSVVTKHFELLRGLAAGERSPVFRRRRSDRVFYSWFVCLRTPASYDLALSGLALLEMDAPRETALHTADLTAARLPAYASAPFQDDRAPQNLRPVGVLERELRHRLGDPELIQRLLVRTFAKEPTWER